MRYTLQKILPEMLYHEGTWIGTYLHVDMKGNILDQHKSKVQCVFPKEQEFVYIQKNTFTWPNEKTVQYQFGGILKSNKIYWNTEKFEGYSWASADNVILLELQRKDQPGVSFTEIIVINDAHNSRVRTWHWFKNGSCFKRTLCQENKLM